MNEQEVVIRSIFKNNIIPVLAKSLEPFLIQLQKDAVFKFEYSNNIGLDIQTDMRTLNLSEVEDTLVRSFTKLKIITNEIKEN